MYSIIRRFFFSLDAEFAHKIGLIGMKWLAVLGLSRLIFGSSATHPREVMGISFPNVIGLAAGLDKNGDYLHGLSQVGFGFIEIGTITPRPQPGNPQPRLFRLPESEAIINRMGFNNAGVEHLINNVKDYRSKYSGTKDNCIIGINIGKNFDTAVENALDDYLICLEKVYQYADYITINISSPNTPGLRNLQFGEQLTELLTGLKKSQQNLAEQYQKYIPLVVKIAPDMSDDEIKSVALTFLDTKIDGVIATNTTISRENLNNSKHQDEAGGLSGKPLKTQATHVVKILSETLQGKIPIIAAGGIFSAEDAKEKLAAGASLVQLYTGFIYQGPELIHECSKIVVN
ncbi:MAG: quinone-dependent dihydroorotate dehydrogenase [Pseudomonadota bacterium]